MNKKSERINVLTEGSGKNIVHAILNAVTKGYTDTIIIDDVLDLVRLNEVSKGTLSACPEALRLYAKSISDSLVNIAKEIENFEIQEQQLMIKRKQQQSKPEPRFDEFQENDDSEDYDDNEDDEIQENKLKTSSINDIKIDEDWEENICEDNKIAGTLLIDFNRDMSIYKKGSVVSLKKSATDYLKDKIYFYFKKEYPHLKTALNEDIFKGNIKFINIKKGKAQLQYEITKAFL